MLSNDLESLISRLEPVLFKSGEAESLNKSEGAMTPLGQRLYIILGNLDSLDLVCKAILKNLQL